MMNCQNCGINWLWDWTEDTLKNLDDEECGLVARHSNECEIWEFKCTCGEHLLTEYCGIGVKLQHNKSWLEQGFNPSDWEKPEHNYRYHKKGIS